MKFHSVMHSPCPQYYYHHCHVPLPSLDTPQHPEKMPASPHPVYEHSKNTKLVGPFYSHILHDLFSEWIQNKNEYIKVFKIKHFKN